MEEESAILNKESTDDIFDFSDFNLTDKTVKDLKKLLSKKRRKAIALKRLRKKAEAAKQKSLQKQDQGDRDYFLRGVLESNLWARQICRDHRTLAKDHLDNLKHYENIESKMYKIGRSVDKILGSMKTTLVYKLDHSPPSNSQNSETSDNFENPMYPTNMQVSSGYFTHIDTSFPSLDSN